MRNCIVFVSLALLACRPLPRGAAKMTEAHGEIRVWSTRAIATVLAEVGVQFERTSGYRIHVVSDLPPAFARRFEAREPFDLLISGSATVDEWIDAGRLTASTRVDLARSGIGVAVRAGTPRPSLGSVEAFRRAVVDAKSIAYLRVGSGLYLDSLFERLSLADAVRHKATRPLGDSVAVLVALGQVELGLVVITQILTSPGVELAGPLPPDIQSYVTFAAAVNAEASDHDAARSL